MAPHNYFKKINGYVNTITNCVLFDASKPLSVSQKTKLVIMCRRSLLYKMKIAQRVKRKRREPREIFPCHVSVDAVSTWIAIPAKVLSVHSTTAVCQSLKTSPS